MVKRKLPNKKNVCTQFRPKVWKLDFKSVIDNQTGGHRGWQTILIQRPIRGRIQNDNRFKTSVFHMLKMKHPSKCPPGTLIALWRHVVYQKPYVDMILFLPSGIVFVFCATHGIPCKHDQATKSKFFHRPRWNKTLSLLFSKCMFPFKNSNQFRASVDKLKRHISFLKWKNATKSGICFLTVANCCFSWVVCFSERTGFDKHKGKHARENLQKKNKHGSPRLRHSCKGFEYWWQINT